MGTHLLVNTWLACMIFGLSDPFVQLLYQWAIVIKKLSKVSLFPFCKKKQRNKTLKWLHLSLHLLYHVIFKRQRCVDDPPWTRLNLVWDSNGVGSKLKCVILTSYRYLQISSVCLRGHILIVSQKSMFIVFFIQLIKYLVKSNPWK